MRFAEHYRGGRPVVSFELFPPKTEKGMEQLEKRLPRLVSLGPAFMTVTYGAMGSTRVRTLGFASKIRNDYGVDTAHHLTCIGLRRDEIDRALDDIQAAGIDNIVALRGDPPAGESEFKPLDDGYGHADDLVDHISKRGGFGIAVAGYPEKHLEAPDFDSDLQYLKRKVDAGADAVITQLYYDNRDYFAFVDRCREAGIEQPIVPGLMPILNLAQTKRITEICGASIPAGLLRKLEDAGDDESRVHEAGIAHTADQAVELLERGVPGIHFFVLNRYFHVAEIMDRIEPALRS